MRRGVGLRRIWRRCWGRGDPAHLRPMQASKDVRSSDKGGRQAGALEAFLAWTSCWGPGSSGCSGWRSGATAVGGGPALPSASSTCWWLRRARIDHVRTWRLWALLDFVVGAIVLAMAFRAEDGSPWGTVLGLGLLVGQLIFVKWRGRRWPRP